MPVFTTAAVAVAAAVATTTVATVAAAVVAVSIAVGTVGLALSVVGMITGDKTLSSVGKYMGYAGIAGGIAGGAIGGIGALSSGGEFVAGAMEPFKNVATLTDKIWNDYGNLNMFTGTTSIADQATLLNPGASLGTTPVAVAADASKGVVPPTEQTIADAAPLGEQPGGFSQNAPAPTPQPGAAPGAPQAVGAPAAPGVDASAYTMAPNQSQIIAPGTGILNPGTTKLPTDAGGFLNWFNNQDSFTKYAVMQGGTTAIQSVGGALGGLFTAASEEEKLKFERERQAFIQGQQGLMNQRTSAAPLVAFDQTRPVRPAGILNS